MLLLKPVLNVKIKKGSILRTQGALNALVISHWHNYQELVIILDDYLDNYSW